MEFIEIKGFRGGDLFYLPNEGHLYVQKSSTEGKKYLVCYNTVVSEDEDDDEDVVHEACSARCTLDEKMGLCYRNTSPHSGHTDHEIKFRDLQSLNAMKDHCRYLATNFPFSARKIPIKEIYLAEMAK